MTERHSPAPSGVQDLGDGLILRGVRDERDVERYIAFNRDVNGEPEGAAATRLLRYHPYTRREDFVLVEDERTGHVVSTTCLIPWSCRYEGIPLRVAMLEMVVTHPNYRHRGLVRSQVARFHQAVEEQGYDLSIIQGIPYYYRQYGYAYALDHSAADALPLWCIPGPEGQAGNSYILRQATDQDIPELTRLYERTMAELKLHVMRDSAYGYYLLRHVQLPTQILEDRRSGRADGYLMTWPAKDHQSTQIVESAIPGMDAAWAALWAMKAEGGQEIRLRWPQSGTLVRLGRTLGSHPTTGYQWLWRIKDVAGLLAKIEPALNGRLAKAGYSGLTTDLLINLYRQAYGIRIQAGRLTGVIPLGFVDASMGANGGDLCIPQEAFLRLVLGYRNLDELRDAWPDIEVAANKRPLLDVLFPRMDTCILMPY